MAERDEIGIRFPTGGLFGWWSYRRYVRQRRAWIKAHSFVEWCEIMDARYGRGWGRI